MHALDLLASSDAGLRRVVDMGCGPGLLARAVTARGLHYAGIDPQSAFIDRHRASGAAENAVFHVGSVQAMPIVIGKGDAFVLNGVAHHLDDADFLRALREAEKASALIICDHWRTDEKLSMLSRWLQAADRGKFVRPFEQFEHLPRFICRHRQTFSIGLGALTFWPYFCLAYTPE